MDGTEAPAPAAEPTRSVSQSRVSSLLLFAVAAAVVFRIATAVFDRGGFQFHGRVAAVAAGAREGGLEI